MISHRKVIVFKSYSWRWNQHIFHISCCYVDNLNVNISLFCLISVKNYDFCKLHANALFCRSVKNCNWIFSNWKSINALFESTRNGFLINFKCIFSYFVCENPLSNFSKDLFGLLYIFPYNGVLNLINVLKTSRKMIIHLWAFEFWNVLFSFLKPSMLQIFQI